MIPISPHLTSDEYDLLIAIVAAGNLDVDCADQSLPKLLRLGVVRVEERVGNTIMAVPTERVHLQITFEPPEKCHE